MERRIMASRDGRNPYGSRGGYVVSRRSRRGRRGDRGMDYGEHDMRGSGSQYSMRRYRDMSDYNQDMRGGDYAQHQNSSMDMRGDYRYDNVYDMARGYDRASQDMRYDGHYPMGHRQGAYEPVEFMGYCSGYYGSPNHRGNDYGYDMRYDRRGMGRDYGDYRYDDYGDYGETLSDKELEEWCHKLKSQLTDQEKQMFSKEMIMQKAKALGRPMEGFSEKEVEVVAIMLLDDYKKTLGANPDIMVKLAFDWLDDKDAKVKGAEKLAVYYDEIVMGGEDD